MHRRLGTDSNREEIDIGILYQRHAQTVQRYLNTRLTIKEDVEDLLVEVSATLCSFSTAAIELECFCLSASHTRQQGDFPRRGAGDLILLRDGEGPTQVKGSDTVVFLQDHCSCFRESAAACRTLSNKILRSSGVVAS